MALEPLDRTGLGLLCDGEVGRDSPALARHHRLARSLLSAGFARELKPDSEERRRLATLVALPPTTRLRDEERELVWKFRYALTEQPRALTKLLKCVDWSDPREAAHARQIASQWAPAEVGDLLELLGPSFVSAPAWVRQCAVDGLRLRASDEQLVAYLLPLVQAVQYEARLPLPPDEAPLGALLVSRAVASVQRAAAAAPAAAPPPPPQPPPTGRAGSGGLGEVGTALLGGLSHAVRGSIGGAAPPAAPAPPAAAAGGGFSELAISLHWYISLERRDPRHGPHYAAVYDALHVGLAATPAGAALRSMLRRQEALVGALSAAAQALKAAGESRPKRIARLQAMFEKDAGPLAPLRSLDAPLILPLDPTAAVVGALPERSTVFKSALSPISVTFRALLRPPAGSGGGASSSTSSDGGGGGSYAIIFKSGDDLRQDQMVLAMLRLMDSLLRAQGLDLQLTAYRVLATAPSEGMVERVAACAPLADILKEQRGDIRRFLAQFHPDSSAPYGIAPAVLERFVKSCAGYCVAMYLMGVGDRHLDNLMLRTDGALFHIDFGYILGRDPKPFPPPMKLCKEMVEAMGGADSRLYERFRVLCCEAFNILRASSNLILNLLLLMVDAGVADLKTEQDVLKVTEKLRLDLSDEEAALYFQELISESVSSLFPQINETIHRWAQYWRS